MVTRLSGRRILVTGGCGFLGSALVRLLAACEPAEIIVPRSRTTDLRREADVAALFGTTRPEIVFHLAASVGGIGANAANPGRFFYDNMAMGLHTIEHAHRAGVDKLILVGTTCSYPKYAPIPFREESLWDGYPEETNAPYGVAKRALITMLQAYRAQYGLNAIALVPANLYGPGDNFDPETSHVIPALIRKFVEAREQRRDHIVAWGTGRATREFLYVEDAAEGLILAAQYYDGGDPVNLGSGAEISIGDVAALIRRLVGFRGEIRWDPSRPDGQPRRQLNTSRAREAFGFVARTPLEPGLRATIDWYVAGIPSQRREGEGVPAASAVVLEQQSGHGGR